MTEKEMGISKRLVEEISEGKSEPAWMRENRLDALAVFEQMKLPTWGPVERLSAIDFSKLRYYVKPDASRSKSWKDVPADIRERYDVLGIPEGEREYLAGLGAQFESEMIYHAIRQELIEKGIVFEEMSEAVRKYPDLVRKYFGSIIPPQNNKFAALNSAVWSGGSFVYIPQGVYLEAPLHNFFQMSTPSQGQFERTLIVAEEGSVLEFIEGCVAPLYSEVSLHAGVVEIIVKKGAQVKYSTMQNWSKNVLNLVTKSSRVETEGTIEWVDGNVGSGVTMKYPSMILAGPKARGQLLSLAFAGDGQVIDSGGKAIHLASETEARIESKSVVKKDGRTSFRGDVHVSEGAENCRTSVSCVSLHLDDSSRSDTYPRFSVYNATATVNHESSILRLNEEQLMYAQSRGLSEEAARGMIVGGFVKPFASELPMEYAVEFDRLVDLEIKDGVG